MVLVSAGQPLFAEDTWLHLAMGEVYAARGPWLPEDPFLYTAQGPPAPAAWLSGLTLHAIERTAGFRGLRIAHVLVVAGILGVVWSALRRASGSPAFASLASALFAALSAYRLFQLRPDLVTVLATLLLFRLLIESGEAPSRRRVAGSALLLALWANAHGGFVLGLALLAAALAGLVFAMPLRLAQRARDAPRARRLAAALGLGFLATLANPAGARPHWLYFAAGGTTPALELVADEWAPVRLFELPVPKLPPSPLAWVAVWGLLLVTPCAVLLQARRRRRVAASPGVAAIDPALVALAAAGSLAPLSAVRLLWLGVFPLLLVGRCARELGPVRGASRRAISWASALAAVLLVAAFVRLGDWPMISQGIHRARYARPYPAGKHHAHAVWFLRDAELGGNLFNDYQDGNFLGYWLAPRLRVFVNGSLNVPRDLMRARAAILDHRGLEPGEGFLALLARQRIDVFLGTGLPRVSPESRPSVSTTTHLERAPGWILVFRNLDGAVYLRRGGRNRSNLERLAAYYERQGVPFDPEQGFDVARVLREAPRWAFEHGLVPGNLVQLERAASSPDPDARSAAQERLAALFAALGLYERAVAIDRDLLRTNPRSVPAARGLVWSLLHQGRYEEGLEEAERLARIAPADDGLSRLLVDSARRCPELSEEERAALVAVLPVFTRPELPAVLAGVREPEARPRKQ